MIPSCIFCGGLLRTTTAAALLFDWGDVGNVAELRDLVAQQGQDARVKVCDSCGVWMAALRLSPSAN